MKVLVDTREQRPLLFNHPWITVTKRKLDTGDYACEFEDGYGPPIVFERKSVPDLFGTLGNGYKRFKRSIIKAQKTNTTIIVIVEGTLSDVFDGHRFSNTNGETNVKKLFTLWIRYGVMPVFCLDKQESAQYITEFFMACGREHIRRKKKENCES